MPRKGENIYKRKDNRWEGRYIRECSGDGALKFGYCYGDSYREVKEKLILAKAGLGDADSDENLMLMADFCDEWLRIKRDRVKYSTLIKYMFILESHIKPALGKLSPGAVNTLVVEDFGHSLLEDKRLAPKSVRDILSVLGSIIQYIQRGHEGMMPRVDIYFPKSDKKEMRVLSKEEEIRLTLYLFDKMDRYKFGILLALMTGMRIGELCALKWGDISTENMTVRVASTVQRIKDLNGGTRVLISAPKSDTSARLIPLGEPIFRLCEQRREATEAYLLSGREDVLIEPRTMQYWFKRYAEFCGIPDVHFHVLRHTFATRCVEVGFEIKSLSEILGHSSPKITLERYVHSSLELKRANMDKLSALCREYYPM